MDRLNAKIEQLHALGVQPWFARFKLGGAAQSQDFHLINANKTFRDENESAPARATTDLALENVAVIAKKPTSIVADVELQSKDTSQDKPDLALDAQHVASERESSASPGRSMSSREAEDSRLDAEGPLLSEGDGEQAVSQADAPTALSPSLSDALPSTLTLTLYSGDHVHVLTRPSSTYSTDAMKDLCTAVVSAFFQDGIQRPLVDTASFSWPIFDSAAFSSHLEEQYGHVFAQFLRKISSAENTTVFSFGSGLDSALLKQLFDQSSVQLVCCDTSIVDCMDDPSHKRALWHELQSLRGA